MRKDMIKVLTERPRTGNGYGSDLPQSKKARKAKKYYMDEDGNDLRSTKQAMSMYGKNFSDLLNPLKRFLNSSVGRKWDDVYSKICENMKPNSIQGKHLLLHVNGYVEKLVAEDERTGRINSYSAYRFSELRRDELYVDKEGILCKYNGINKYGHRGYVYDAIYKSSMLRTETGEYKTFISHVKSILNKDWEDAYDYLSKLIFDTRVGGEFYVTKDLLFKALFGSSEVITSYHDSFFCYVSGGRLKMVQGHDKIKTRHKNNKIRAAEKKQSFEEEQKRMAELKRVRLEVQQLV